MYNQRMHIFAFDGSNFFIEKRSYRKPNRLQHSIYEIIRQELTSIEENQVIDFNFR